VSASEDRTLRVWDVNTGRLLNKLEGHTDGVSTVAVASKMGAIASGSRDKTIKIWSLDEGKPLQTLRGHSGVVTCIAVDAREHTLASASEDREVNLWDFRSWDLRVTLKGHTDAVYSIAFDPKGKTIATAGWDKTVRIWDCGDGKLLRILEGHVSGVSCVCFSSDGKLIATRGSLPDDAVRLWSTKKGSCLAVLSDFTSGLWPPGMAFHPSKPHLAAVASDIDLPNSQRDHLIVIHAVDPHFLLTRTQRKTVVYTSAKVVLVGESNVGKSYLAHRIVTGRPPAEGVIKSTHGMKFWPIDLGAFSPRAKLPPGQRRDVVLWDLGGQEEYRLIHQLFLHDTTVALILIDPTRGATAFKEVETWSKYLEKQLQGQAPAKLLIGAKLDSPSDMIDVPGLNRLRDSCKFTGYYETSARTGRGVADLCAAVAIAIDWDALGKTSRPELFQRIRDHISLRRKRGDVILHVTELYRALAIDTLTSDGSAVTAVVSQLAAQGTVAISQVSTGEAVLVLQIEQIERYAGSLILAARNNPRGVPALELTSLGQPEITFPGIQDRLPRVQERPVVEATVQLLLKHGICFEHQGLLIFPSCFTSGSASVEIRRPHTVLLYYDFSGAIDNIYASLVALLVLARDFGNVRLTADGAEYEVRDMGLCGIRKVLRTGGFAHLDVYFEEATPKAARDLFVSCIEDHLKRFGVDIHEHLAITCSCGISLDEDTVRRRIARGDRDVLCPVCEVRHSISEGARATRERDEKLERRMWALKTRVEERRETTARAATAALERAPQERQTEIPIRLLHLSDLHFDRDTSVKARLQWLVSDLRANGNFHSDGISVLDYLVISGDFTNKGSIEGFERAYEFVAGLTSTFDISAERCVFVPGNHDLKDIEDAFETRESASGDRVIVQTDKYHHRIQPFSDNFYHKFLQRPYPLDYVAQGIVIPFLESKIQFLTFNSCWQIDRFNRKRSGMHPDAVAFALNEADKQLANARASMGLEEQPLRIAVWHHAVAGPDQMRDTEFLGHLQKCGVRIVLHGDVHEVHRGLIRHWIPSPLRIVGCGTFSAPASERPESIPRLYNLLEIKRNLTSVRVHTRCQLKPDGPWMPWNEWPRPDRGPGAVPYFDIDLE
jgi:GTPase SAR1 family protein